MSQLQALYDLEINFDVSCFWDGGFDVWLGDDMNGLLEEANVDYWHQVTPWLIEMSIKHYPGCRTELGAVLKTSLQAAE